LKKIIVLGTLFLSVLAGCSSRSASPSKPEIFADKGVYFAQDKEKSLASNLTAFAGYPNLVSDHDMPTGLRRGLDFTSGTYIGFNAFNSLWGATGFGALTMITGDDIAPLTPSSIVLMTPLNPGEQYNDLSVAKRAVENSLEKIDGSFLAKNPNSAAYEKELKRLKFSENKSMNGVVCNEPGMAEKMLRHNDASCGIDGFNVEVYFARPANGNEFPELKELPKANYAVLLLNIYSDYKLRKDILWGASFDSEKKSFTFDEYTLPFVSPDKSGKRILIKGQDEKTKILYK
jgi:hypothetical protein